MYGKNITVLPAAPNPWMGLLSGLGAYMAHQQNQQQEANAYGDASNYINGIGNTDLGGQTNYQDLTPEGSNVQQQTAQGLLPTNFNQMVPTADNVGQGLIGSSTPPQNIQQINDPNLSAQLPPTSADITNPMAQYSKADNPMATTVSAPKSINEARTAIMSSIPTAHKELISKFGAANAAKVMPLLMQAANDKMSDYTNQYNQQKVQGLMQAFNDPKTSDQQKAWIAAQANKMYGIDIGKTTQQLRGDYGTANLGGSTQLYNKYTGQPGQTFANSQSPDNSANNDVKKYLHDNQSADNAATTSASIQAAGIRAAGGGGSRTNHYQEGSGTLNGKQLDPEKIGKYNDKYNEIMSDIYDSKTPQERASKIANYSTVLNSLGQVLDKDVLNDVDYVTKTNPLGNESN